MRHIALASALAILTPLASAQVPAVLGTCIVTHLSPDDRQDIARWVYLSMSVHPGVRRLSTESTKATEEAAAQKMGALFTRTLRDMCPRELREAAGAGGPPIVSSAINFFTQLGVQELMTNKEVLAVHSSFSQYADREGIDRIVRTK